MAAMTPREGSRGEDAVKPDPSAADRGQPSPSPGAVRVSILADDPPLPPVVVEPETGARLDRIDGTRAVLTIGDEPESRRVVLLGPPRPGGRRGVVRREVVIDGWRVELEVEWEHHARLRERARRENNAAARGGPTEVRAIIPGVVVSVAVAAGDEVEAGQQLLVVEAMKMQNELRAPRRGRVERVDVGPGKTIELGQLLLVLA